MQHDDRPSYSVPARDSPYAEDSGFELFDHPGKYSADELIATIRDFLVNSNTENRSTRPKRAHSAMGATLRRELSLN